MIGRPRWVECPAKVNLFLEVIRRRPDGYHDLATVMVAVSLADRLSVEPARRDRLEVEPAGSAPADGSNTVMRALAALRRRAAVPPVRVRLVKRIPSGSGLGGGSSDAAGLVRAANRRFGLGLAVETARAVLAEVGSDTSFFATGGAAICTGRGEVVTPLPETLRLAFVVVAPGAPNPTGEIYRLLKLPLTDRRERVSRFLNSLAGGDPHRVALFNRLEQPAFEFRPELRAIKRGLASMPFAGALMTGSGSALYGLCARGADLRRLERRVRSRGWGRSYAATTVGSWDMTDT